MSANDNTNEKSGSKMLCSVCDKFYYIAKGGTEHMCQQCIDEEYERILIEYTRELELTQEQAQEDREKNPVEYDDLSYELGRDSYIRQTDIDRDAQRDKDYFKR